MRILLTRLQKKPWFLGCLMILSSQMAVSQNLFCERFGDNRLATWISKVTSNGTYKGIIKEDEFMFRNLSKHPVSFYYNGVNIHLAADALSPAFKKPLPVSLADCRVMIDGIPLQNYYTSLGFLDQDYENLPVSRKFPNDKTVEELKKDLDVYRKTLAQVKNIQSGMPAWFSQMKNIDNRISQVNGWLKTHNDWLSQKTTAQVNEPAKVATATSSSTMSKPKQAFGSQAANKPGNPGNDSFWSDKPERKTADPGNVVPDNPAHKNLPDFVRTTDGGYFYRDADGKFREVSEKEYQQAKTAAATARPERNQPTPARQQVTVNDIMATVKKDQAANQAIFDNIDQMIAQKADAWRQNFYHAEAIRNGKSNLSGLSRLEGNYNSVQELEAEFNQKYNSIRSEVSNLEQARNAQLNIAVASNFNGNGTEQAIGQGIQLIGNMVNSAKANKEAKEAQAALKADRENAVAAIAVAKKRAIVELKNKLLSSFPNGGLPLTAHRVSQPEVYIFTYITDKQAFYNDQALVSVSNVYPIAQYSDGTFPYKTSVLNKVKGYAPGEVTIVGYYNSKEIAEQMRNSFVNLAAKSNLQVKSFIIKGTTGTNSAEPAGSGDFWETGKKTAPAIPAANKKTDFWNN